MRRGLLLAGVFVSGAAVATATSQPSLPPALDTFVVSEAKLTPAERSALLSGAPVTKMLAADPAQEVSLFGAVWIDAPPASYVRLVKDIERFESGGAFRVTKRISDPPQLADFAALDLPDDDVADLKSCKVGDCEIKLAESALVRIRTTIDWTTRTAVADVEALAKQLAFEFVTGYAKGGNQALAVYRDSARPTFVATEFASMIDRIPQLGTLLPDLKAYLLGYPQVTLPNATSFLYWQEAQFGLKPTIRISHVVIDERPAATIVASKLLYASHYFWTALDLRVLVPDPARGRGFWFVNVTRSRSDGLSGFVGRLIRGKVQGEAQKSLESALRGTKIKVEQAK